MLAPSGWLSRVSMHSCLVTPSGASACIGGLAAICVACDSPERGRFLGLVMRSICGSSALGGRFAPVARAGFDPTGRSCFFGLAAPEGAFGRLDAKDWALPFLGIALSMFRL